MSPEKNQSLKATITIRQQNRIKTILQFLYSTYFRLRMLNLGSLRILRLQKRAARIVLNTDFTTRSKSMFMELKWLPFPERVKYHSCVMVYKAINNKTPEYISNMFSKSVDTHGRNLRSADRDMLRVSYTRIQYYENSFRIDGAKNWNSLPLNIRTTSSIESVKKSLKEYLHNSFQSILCRVTLPTVQRVSTRFEVRGMLSGHWFPPHVLCSAMCYSPRCIAGMEVSFGSAISKYNSYKYHSD